MRKFKFPFPNNSQHTAGLIHMNAISWVTLFVFFGIIPMLTSLSDSNHSSHTANIMNLPGDEICGNSIDDDGDGLIDADDPDCITAGACGCPPGGIVYDTISSGHIIPIGAIHCINEDVTLNDAWNNITLNGSLYIIDTAHLWIDGGINMGANSNLIVCENASYAHQQTVNVYRNIYNFGWLQISGTGTDVDTIVAGPNSLTALKGNGLNINGAMDYVGPASGSAYFFLDISTSLNGSSGSVCLPGGSSEMVVEVDAASTTPTCVTDCAGCPELASITQIYNDGSVEAAFSALPPILEICNNSIDDNGDGRTDEPFPGGVQTSMQLWLKAEQGTNTTVSGNNITSWGDQSVNGYSADADASATDWPTYSETAINFNPGVEFDGDYTDDNSDGLHLGSDYIFSDKDGLHVFAVCDPNIDSETDNYVFDFGLQANGGYGMIYSNNDYGVYTNNMFGGTNTELFHTEGDEPALVEIDIDFDDHQAFFRNGTELVNIAVTIPQQTASEVNEQAQYTTPSASSGPVSIGRKSASIFLSNDGGRMFDGHISEIIVYNDSLSEVEKQSVNSYLAFKYGITLNHDYVSSTGSVKKVISDGYANNIAAIGIDECSGLHQKQSKSVEPDAIVTVGVGSIAANNQANAGTVGSDGTFLVWGHDGTAANASWNAANVSIGGGDYSRIDRVWSFSEHFIVAAVSLQVEVDHASFDLPALPASSDGSYYLLIDDDGDFTNGGTTATQMSLVSGDAWDAIISDPSDSYFSFGINEYVCDAQAPMLTK